MQIINNYINGEIITSSSGALLDCIAPASGEVYAQLPDSTSIDVQSAVDAGKKAFPGWSSTSVQERCAWLMRIARAIDDQADALALAECHDTGKPLRLARELDIARASANLSFFAQAMSQFASAAYAMPAPAINYTLRDPLGVVACISPWNLPLYLLTWKIAPALAAGNCVVAKPSEITPMTAFHLAKICAHVGLPKGVLNIVHGIGRNVGEALCSHPDMRAISFTGGTKTGQRIAKCAAGTFKKLALEMGGKNPSIVFADCNWDAMLATVVRAAFLNQGQICLAGSRIFVQRAIYDDFKHAFVAKVAALVQGDPLLETTEQGALVSKAHLEKVLAAVDVACAEGGEVLTGGQRAVIGGRCAQGYFMQPTVIDNLDSLATCNQEEIFGPFATLIPFDDEKDVLAMANNVRYGLCASVWTQNLDRAHRLAKQLACGMVWVNTWLLRDLRTPFGGIKDSGLGREGGVEALHFFTEPKNVCIRYQWQ